MSGNRIFGCKREIKPEPLVANVLQLNKDVHERAKEAYRFPLEMVQLVPPSDPQVSTITQLADAMRQSVVVTKRALDLSLEAHKFVSGDPFDILGLPTELLSNVFSFLPIKDRLRLAGVNKRLNTIEKESKYYVKKLVIEEMSISSEEEEGEEDEEEGENDVENDPPQRITLYEEKSYSSDCIKRIAPNASIGTLDVDLTGSAEFHREVYNLIKKFDIGHLVIRRDILPRYFDSDSEDNDNDDEGMVDDSFLLDLTRACKYLSVYELCEKITPEALHHVYKDMIEGSAKLRELEIGICKEKCHSFFNLIGVTHRNGKYYSNRDIELYERNLGVLTVGSHIFDEVLEIFLDQYDGSLILILHETLESLEKAKNQTGMDRIDITPE